MTEYTQGAPCWVDVTTTEPDVAQRFYRDLFGWEWEGGDIPEGGAYWMAALAGEPVAGMSVAPDDLPDSVLGWNVWIGVGDVDDAAARAVANGAATVVPPFDVPGMGRGDAAHGSVTRG